MTLPQPSSTFTIPSLQDDVELDCHLYYPRRRRSSSDSSQGLRSSGRAFAIVAHPYASLGGSQDDGVVASVGSVLLQQGYVLGTFNFRGAGGSAGRTSWTGRSELADYVSFYGFMLCLMSVVVADQVSASSDASKERQDNTPQLLLGGYSYGSLIASCLPSYEIVAGIFNNPAVDSTEAEIRGRADKLGRDLRAYFAMLRDGALDRGRTSLRLSESDTSPTKRNIAMGGYDSSEAANRRVSRESSRVSFDGERIRQSMDRTRQRFRSHFSSNERDLDSSSNSNTMIDPQLPSEAILIKPMITYLLVSPLLGPISMATTMFSKPTFELRDKKLGRVSVKDTQAKDDKFLEHQTCIIFGTKDVFTPEKKARRWADELSNRSNGKVCSFPVIGAGHFWIEEGAMTRLTGNLKGWLEQLRRPRGSSNVE